MEKMSVNPIVEVTAAELPALLVIEGKVMATSLDVSEVFKKAHKHVLRDIEEIIKSCPAEFGRPNFGLSSYLNVQNKAQPMYNLTRDAFMLVAMGFSGAKAVEFKVAYISAFNRMEKSVLGILDVSGTEGARFEINHLRPLRFQDRASWLKADFGYSEQDIELIGLALDNFANRLEGVLTVERVSSFRRGFLERYYRILSRSMEKQRMLAPAHRLSFALSILADFTFSEMKGINEALIGMGQKAI